MACLLDVSYAAGRFRLKMKAGLCLGVGAKGEIELSVDALCIADFVAWFFYQLYHANFKHLQYIQNEAFQAMTYIQVTVIQGAQKLTDSIDLDIADLQRSFADLLLSYEQEQQRVQLMNNILANPWMLQYATPESKGIMLYQLTRHWAFTDGPDPENHAFGRYYGRRKDAVKQILQWSHTRHDLDNVVQHMNRGGTKGDLTQNRIALKNFLSMSLTGTPASDAQEMDDYYDSLQAMLKVDPTPGYAVVEVASQAYSFQAAAGEHPMYESLPDTRLA
ncbi:hypothetical protein [Paraburkholderia pallida]|uniref:Uncharacterized protein n=1 Tax=Paraburkholderia pallida TaxID=2547399 RepID=A0A4P7D379_9BURK|nr:hypothetical protein [Paraburkholderia pallida]QBR01707.1 hypothetical protein E1956_31605 [Paraburkholderia pallida]